MDSQLPSTTSAAIKTDIPARLDRLPWSRFHLLIVIGLGVTWILDGLEVTIVGALGPALQNSATLHLSSADLGAVASFYVVGAVTGALISGWVTDRFGRRLVFYATLLVYLAGVLLSACAWDFLSFALFRMLTGMGIGGEYAAVNSAIDELIPAKYRGRIDLIVNGSFWVGAAAGAAITPLLLDSKFVFGQCRLAPRLWHRRRARIVHSYASSLRAGEPALAGDALPEGGRRSNRAGDRNRRDVVDRPRAGTGQGNHHGASEEIVRARHHFRVDAGRAPAAQRAGADVDDRAVVSLQFCILQLRIDSGPLLQGAGSAHWLLSAAAGAWKFLRPAVARHLLSTPSGVAR